MLVENFSNPNWLGCRGDPLPFVETADLWALLEVDTILSELSRSVSVNLAPFHGQNESFFPGSKFIDSSYLTLDQTVFQFNWWNCGFREQWLLLPERQFPSFFPPSLSPSLSLLSSLSLSFAFFSLCLSLFCPLFFSGCRFFKKSPVIFGCLLELSCCLVPLTFVIWVAGWINSLLKICKIQGWLCPVLLWISEFHKENCFLRDVIVAAWVF